MSDVKALMTRNGQVVGTADIYRDGDVVTIVADGGGEHQTPYGTVRTKVHVEQQFDTVEAYEHMRDRLAKNSRFALAYARMIGRLGIDDDARRAPPLPPELRHLLPEHARALGDGSTSAVATGASGARREAPGRPYLALLAGGRGR